MIHLRTLVNELNQAIALRIKETAKLNGLVRPIHRQQDGSSEVLNVDNLSNPVVIDDRWNINLWHRVTAIDAQQLTGQGRGNKYRFDAKMLLVCSAKNENVHDLLVFILSRQKNVTYSSSDFDSSRIIRRETGKSDLNIENALFSIEYVLSYLSEKCFEDCQFDTAPATLGATDCIEVSQGGVISA